jgi:hypothetical protein
VFYYLATVKKSKKKIMYHFKTKGIMKTALNISKSTFTASHSVVRKPGKYLIIAGNNNRIFDENLKKHKHIVNLRAVTEANVPKVMEKFAGKAEIDITDLNGLTMSANIIENEGQVVSLPIPGEKVEAIIDWVEGREGKVLAVIKLGIAKAVEAEKFSFDDATAPSETEKKEQTISVTGNAPVTKTEEVKEKKDSFV